ncbi:MAG: hypothetical protein COW30_09580 [Rhodospirillales bacterium CG15_BIG_FIL_POST_REV_8_21_14_020_66_15]|nr:MAG: hypothetical protein COW30_09580 [Rhodospirillales bacterium CG15_BIG_FIL_POST_REV_8_21_14_020_66_15]
MEDKAYGADSVTSTMGYLEYTVLPLDPALMPGEMVKVLEYWETARGDRWAPPWSEFKLFDLPPRIIPMTVVVDVHDDGLAAARFVYRFWGTHRTELYGRENAGREVRDALPDKAGPVIAEQLGLVVKARAPALFRNVYPFKPAEVATCVTLRLPIASADGRQVDKIASTAIIIDNQDAFVGYVTAPGAITADGS